MNFVLIFIIHGLQICYREDQVVPVSSPTTSTMEGNRRNAGAGNGGGGSNGTGRCGDFLMAGIRKRRVVGSRIATGSSVHKKSLLKRLKGSMGYADQKLYTARQFQEGSNKYEEFFCYNENEDGDEVLGPDGEPQGETQMKM